MAGLVGLGLGLASQASREYLPRMAIHTATAEASRVGVYSRVYSISLSVFVIMFVCFMCIFCMRCP